MYLHREGKATITIVTIAVAIIIWLGLKFLPGTGFIAVLIIAIAFWIFILSFFRNPQRKMRPLKEGHLNCPADGKIVLIEEVQEGEYLKDKRLMVSIFMSPLNVHVNRNPVSGNVKYVKYHPGTYLAAWHPKASTENERTTIVYESQGQEILMRQIAGALARRIVFYLKPGDEVKAGKEMGFIKFGSRVDLYLPLNTKVLVEIGQVVRGNVDVIAVI
jgi:phosphatidylserine decarboxylase